MASGGQSGDQVASRVGQSKVPRGVRSGPSAGVDQHRRVRAGVGEQQVHRVAAQQNDPLQIGDAPSGQAPLEAVVEARAGLGHRAGCAGLGRRALVARSQRRRTPREEGGQAALVLPEGAASHLDQRTRNAPPHERYANARPPSTG
ncbi:hypothetical protein [Streptomyces sp. NPDC058145]|uniref:hypothetical protein n=1 Tax=Streptomyces sp. NPDC058145 TaxID=3346356 RepID=UPI0036E7E222